MKKITPRQRYKIVEWFTVYRPDPTNSPDKDLNWLDITHEYETGSVMYDDTKIEIDTASPDSVTVAWIKPNHLNPEFSDLRLGQHKTTHINFKDCGLEDSEMNAFEETYNLLGLDGIKKQLGFIMDSYSLDFYGPFNVEDLSTASTNESLNRILELANIKGKK